MLIYLTDDELKEHILQEVGKGKRTAQDGIETLERFGITVPQGFKNSLLAFEASAILENNGFTRNGYRRTASA